MIDPKHFRDVLGSYPTGVCVVTSLAHDGERFGLAVGSFTSISLDPPLVGFLPDKSSRSWARIAPTGRFCVNVLASEQLDACRRFASKLEDKFEGMAHGHSPAGLPLLDNVLAWIECDIAQTIEIGDHLLVVGAVRAMERRSDGTPLLFYRGGYHTLAGLDQATA
ncbi:flavin reductase family protein [Sphingobium nicotianae]|uniref:Flavin reductase family protein n=1 Tax=Sphingobium nicotianae TaxID=2782607 RepID=A0A9X1DES9_9SPHN|nr:flavin reductase family protein [Sphingobium nicotianae]MBT2188875.1 flavin reductase family protein [Sphingobium nicotianae]